YGNLNLANRSFTVEFWAKRDQLDRMAMILSQGETEVNKGLHIGFRSDGKFTFAFYSDDLDTDSPYNDFEWHHWVCVYELEGKTRTIYRDGEQIGQDHANKIYQGSGNLVLGQRFDAKHSFVGRLAEVRIWQVALTQEEIKINSKIRLSGNEPGLLAYYPLHEPSQVRDLTGSQKDAEILGTASWCRSTVPIGQFKPSEISLDGVDDYLEIANSEAINFATNQDFTVEAWIKADRIQQDTKNTDNDIIEKWSGQSGYPYVIRYVNTSGKIYAARYDGTKSASINSTITVNDGVFHHVAFVKAGTQLLLYIDGDLAKGGSGTDTVSGNTQNDSPLYIGCRGGNSKINFFTGQIAELRLWNKARTEQEIQSDMNRRLTGEEDGLVGYWALHEIQGDKVSDLKSANNGIVNGAVTIQDTSLPIWGDALISCEYSTIGLNSNQKKSAMMRRFLAFPSLAGINLLAGQRIEELELVWAGNAQVNPTLLGYIEGAPPVPSENLTVEDNYNGATSVQLLSSEEVSYSWNREQDAGLGATASLFLGVDKNLDLLEVEVKAGFQGDLSLQYSFLNSTNISASSGINITNGLSLVGNQEYDAKFTKLGMRFIPKNVGYALVVSGLADVYVIRLNRTKKIVGYQIVP
ncbi:MAG: LamG domain-containing protein, partial [Prochlorotrichaceae cyanobacterium]